MQPVSDPTTIAARSRLGTKTSEVLNAGRCLFTYNRIREGKSIGEYFGDNVIQGHDYGQINNLITAYSMGNRDNSHIYCAFSIARNRMLCVSGYINDPLDDSKCNVRAVWRGARCMIVAVRDIEPGEELLMAYGEAYWMRLCWSSEIIQLAWDNYGLLRTNARWEELYHRKLEIEALGELSEEDVYESDDEVNEDGGEMGVVFRGEPVQRILIDFTQGDEPIVSVIQVAVTPEVAPEVPAFIPYTHQSPEYLQYLQEEHVVVRNSCA